MESEAGQISKGSKCQPQETSINWWDYLATVLTDGQISPGKISLIHGHCSNSDSFSLFLLDSVLEPKSYIEMNWTEVKVVLNRCW